MLRVQTPMIPLIGEMIARRPGTISLGQGMVHYGPPEAALTAAAEAARAGPEVDRYGAAFGIKPLVDAIAAKAQTENGASLDGRQIVVTAGSNMGFLTAILAIADPGDEVILLAPYYFNHEMAIEIAGCRTVAVATDNQYQPDLPAIEAAVTPRTRAVVTVSPNNPTGALYPAAALRAINDLCRRQDIYHIADEAYEYFTYPGGEHFSPMSIPGGAGHTISLFTLSKSYGMAGWRVGYMVMPEHLDQAVKKIQDTNLICPPILNQRAAAAALNAGKAWCLPHAADLGPVRDQALDELARLGDRVDIPRPGGAFYMMVRVHTKRTDLELVEGLIRDFGVAVLPGSTFGVQSGCLLRIAFGALRADTVAEGIGRLRRGLEQVV